MSCVPGQVALGERTVTVGDTLDGTAYVVLLGVIGTQRFPLRSRLRLRCRGLRRGGRRGGRWLLRGASVPSLPDCVQTIAERVQTGSSLVPGIGGTGSQQAESTKRKTQLVTSGPALDTASHFTEGSLGSVANVKLYRFRSRLLTIHMHSLRGCYSLSRLRIYTMGG